MIVNDSKIIELENKMKEFEFILKDIRDNLKFQNEKKSQVKDDNEYKLTSIQKEKIVDILNNFDFQKVHNVMTYLNWRWVHAKNGVPTIDELKGEATRLLTTACIERNCISTGGFRAVYDEGCQGDPDPYIGLEFIIEDCEGFVDNKDDDE